MSSSSQPLLGSRPAPTDLPEDMSVSYNPSRAFMVAPEDMTMSSGRLSPQMRDELEQTPDLGDSETRAVLGIAPSVMDTAAAPHVIRSITPIPNLTGQRGIVSTSTYQLRGMIGRGGFGEVFEGVQTSLGRTVAVKRLNDRVMEQASKDPAKLKWLEIQFRQEALTTANLEHPNIVPVYDIGTDERGRAVLAMKLVKGDNWERVLRDDFERLDPEAHYARHLPILISVAQAVAFAHSRGIVHRDLKPAQVMVGEFGEVMLMDWGLAMIFDTDAVASETISAFGRWAPTNESASNPAGTVAFMAPEQTEENAENIGPWTDVYLLGGMLYFILTGRPPHESGNSTQSFYRAATGKLEPPQTRAIGRRVPEDLARVCLEAMNPIPARRTGSAREFIRGVEGYLTGAGKKVESLATTRRVASFLESARGDYREYSETLAAIASAEALWSGNPDVATLRERVLEAYVRDALANRDLTLARLHVDMLPRGDVKTKLLFQLESAVREVRRESAQRRMWMTGAWVLALVLIAVLVVREASHRGDDPLPVSPAAPPAAAGGG